MLKVGTTFSGIGAPEQALKNSRIEHEVKWACDIDKKAKETYFLNHRCNVWYDDISKIDIKNLEPVDLYVFGFPCQSLSIVGKQNLLDGRSALVSYSLDIIDFLLPKYILFENVFALKQKKFERFFSEIQTRIKAYYNFEWRQLNSIDFGVPQSRRRIFGLGVRKDIGVANLSLFQHPKISLAGILEQNADKKYFLDTVKTNKILEIAEEMVPNFQFQNQIGLVNGVNKFNKTSIFASIKIQYKDFCSCLNLIDLYGIIYPDKSIRRLTPREYARLQGFPDSFIVNPKDAVAYRQFGNTITVPILEEIFKLNLV